MAPAPPMSPQKRVTRARTAAKKAGVDSKTPTASLVRKTTGRKTAEAVDEHSVQSDMPTVSEPLRKSARRIAPSAPARRIKITPLDTGTSSQHMQQKAENTPQVPPKRRITRSKKAHTDETEKEDTEAPKAAKLKRQAADVADTVEENKLASHRPRGRPRKVAVIPDETAADGGRAPEGNGVQTRSGVASTTAAITAPPKTTVPKKVTFQGLVGCDKENQPVLHSTVKTNGRATAPANGIKAKPVRRPATKPRAARSDVTKRHDEAASQKVLTPKKVTQVAKSSSLSDSDEDELSGAKTPIRDLSQSARRNASVARSVSPMKKLDFCSGASASSPVKSQIMSALLSPAKRPPSSPHKEAFKESPRRGDLSFQFPPIPRFDGADKARDPAMSSNAMLLQSPKRVPLETIRFPLSTSKVGESPFKASLLHSPPKRPVSPIKTVSTPRVNKGTAAPPKEADTKGTTPDVTVLSNYRVDHLSQRSVEVHQVAIEKQETNIACAVDFDESIVDIRSPLKVDIEKLNSLDQGQEDPCLKNLESDILGGFPAIRSDRRDYDLPSERLVTAEDGSTLQSGEEAENTYAVPSTLMLHEQTPVKATSFLFRDSRLGVDDDSSEDELLSPIRAFQPETPAIILSNKSTSPITNLSAVEQAPAFTPLAAQLSEWLASNPEKEPTKRSRQRGLFSPVAQQHVPGEVIIDRRSPATSRVSTATRFSMPARRSIGNKKSPNPRSCLAVSVLASPDLSSHFADEMVVKDLEEAIESTQEDGHASNLPEELISTESTNPLAMGEHAIASVTDKVQDFCPEQPNDTYDGIAVEMQHSSHDQLSQNSAGEGEAEDGQLMQGISQESAASSIDTDENFWSIASTQQSGAIPAFFVPPASGSPLNNFTTPLRPQAMPQFAKTVVSKVPLLPEGNSSPIRVPKKRSRSLSAGRPSVKKTPILQASGFPRSIMVNDFSPISTEINAPISVTSTPGQQSFAIDDFGDSTLDGIDIDEEDENLPPVTPLATSAQTFTATPSKTVKEPKNRAPAPSAGVLQGAVVFVDVHTTEGADASGIFVELLAQMGAKCVKNWSWNPRASTGVNLDDSAAVPGAGAGTGKIGITHVVYKDGGKRTLEKVRDTDGVVKCVGVGWVLDCERENKWLDEFAYAVDISILPRGGSRRRKSMEPRALLNLNGNLSQATGPSKRTFSAEMTKKLNQDLINTPVRDSAPRRISNSTSDSDIADDQAETEHAESVLVSDFSTPTGVSAFHHPIPSPAATPTGFVNYDPSSTLHRTPISGTPGPRDDGAAYSPTTPYYLTQGAKLVQMTCPPKQTGKGLFEREGGDGAGSRDSRSGTLGPVVAFPLSGRIADAGDEAVRKRLVEARRRTMGWRPRVASPLGR